jgi:hypothetical protein
VELPPEILRTANLQGSEFLGHPNETSRGSLVQLGVVFVVSYVLLFAGMSRRPGMYDEGIVLTGAMRVAAGQIPHRDFYFIYGPAEVYGLAGLFKIFGESLLAERLFDLSIKALLLTTVYALVSSQCRRAIAVFISIVAFLWIFGLNQFGLATTPISLLNLIGSSLILPAFVGRVSTRRMVAAGAISGLAALFRYDTGIALLGIHACVMAIAICLRCKGTANRLLTFASTFWPYLLGFALLTIPPAIYYFSRAPLASLLYDVVIFPSRYYHRARYLPFPGIYLRGLENLGVYVPIAITGISLYALAEHRLPARVRPAAHFEDIPEPRAWQGFLVTFSLLLVVMYGKGLVRVGPLQMYLAVIPSLLLVAVLFQQRSAFPRPISISIVCLMWLSLVPAVWSALHEIRLEDLQHSSVAQRIFSFAGNAPPETETAWCKIANPLTVGFCFLPEDDRMQAIEFIRSHTRPEQRLYSGLDHHDTVFANDNLIYFASQRLPATRWSHFDPDLQNRYDIQLQMVQELERTTPPYIVLDSEFDLVREPNDSSKSSGVTLLDRYIQENYQPRETFGEISVWQRRSP